MLCCTLTSLSYFARASFFFFISVSSISSSSIIALLYSKSDALYIGRSGNVHRGRWVHYIFRRTLHGSPYLSSIKRKQQQLFITHSCISPLGLDHVLRQVPSEIYLWKAHWLYFAPSPSNIAIKGEKFIFLTWKH